MMKLTVDADRDHVILAFGAKGQHLFLTPHQVDAMVAAIRSQIPNCENWVKGGGRRKVIKDPHARAGVAAREGKIVLEFERRTDRESIPYKGAADLANTLEQAAIAARHQAIGKVYQGWTDQV